MNSDDGRDAVDLSPRGSALAVEYARIVRRCRRVLALLASWCRIIVIRLTQPGVRIGFDSFLGPRCVVRCAPRGRLVVRGTVLTSDIHLEAADGALLDVAADMIGPRAVLVARQRVVVGPGSLIAELSVLRDQDHLVEPGTPTTAMRFVSAPVTLGRGVWLGANVTVLKGVTIGDGAIVGAGAVVTADVPPDGRYGGVPAQPLGRRGPSGPGLAAPRVPGARRPGPSRQHGWVDSAGGSTARLGRQRGRVDSADRSQPRVFRQVASTIVAATKRTFRRWSSRTSARARAAVPRS